MDGSETTRISECCPLNPRPGHDERFGFLVQDIL